MGNNNSNFIDKVHISKFIQLIQDCDYENSRLLLSHLENLRMDIYNLQFDGLYNKKINAKERVDMDFSGIIIKSYQLNTKDFVNTIQIKLYNATFLHICTIHAIICELFNLKIDGISDLIQFICSKNINVVILLFIHIKKCEIVVE